MVGLIFNHFCKSSYLFYSSLYSLSVFRAGQQNYLVNFSHIFGMSYFI